MATAYVQVTDGTFPRPDGGFYAAYRSLYPGPACTHVESDGLHDGPNFEPGQTITEAFHAWLDPDDAAVDVISPEGRWSVVVEVSYDPATQLGLPPGYTSVQEQPYRESDSGPAGSIRRDKLNARRNQIVDLLGATVVAVV